MSIGDFRENLTNAEMAIEKSRDKLAGLASTAKSFYGRALVKVSSPPAIAKTVVDGVGKATKVPGVSNLLQKLGPYSLTALQPYSLTASGATFSELSTKAKVISTTSAPFFRCPFFWN